MDNGTGSYAFTGVSLFIVIRHLVSWVQLRFSNRLAAGFK
jgi:hypothetical protein